MMRGTNGQLACRAHCTPGYIVPCQQVAFSQPTEAGQRFASKYTGTEEFLVYKPI